MKYPRLPASSRFLLTAWETTYAPQGSMPLKRHLHLDALRSTAGAVKGKNVFAESGRFGNIARNNTFDSIDDILLVFFAQMP